MSSSWVRPASHAGSWYSGDPVELERQLADWLASAASEDVTGVGRVRAVIAPHAGYRYSGEVAAHSYRVLADAADAGGLRRVFVLGPSHHYRLNGCALTSAVGLETPLGRLPVDRATVAELAAEAHFEELPHNADEAEHSVEMQLPYVARATARLRRLPNAGGFVGVVPILVGQCTAAETASYATLLSRHLTDPSALFVISSDFCHWGRKFRYTRRGFDDDDSVEEPIWRGIERMDRLGMSAIESLEAEKFASYLEHCGNTICGRKPIGLLLATLAVARGNGISDGWSMRFLRYAQSNRCLTEADTSVSYAAGALFMAKTS